MPRKRRSFPAELKAKVALEALRGIQTAGVDSALLLSRQACYDLGAVKIKVTEHARRQAERRGIPEQTVVSVATEPQQTIRLRPDREVRQSRVRLAGDPMEYLVRVIVDRLPDEIRIVTAYRTSKIRKYWERS